MKKIILCLFMLLTLGVTVLSAKTEVTIYCDDSYPPFCYNENNKAYGIYVGILQKAFEKMPDYDVTIKPTPWKRGLSMLEKGSAFALFPPYKNEKDRPYIKPYSEPIIEEKVSVFGLKEKVAGKTNWPNDFYNSKIGVNLGFNLTNMGGAEFVKAIKDKKITLDEAKGNKANILKLGKGRTDYYLNSAISVLWEYKRLRNEGMYDLEKFKPIYEGMAVKSEWGYLGYSNTDNAKYSFKADFVKKLDIILKEMKANGDIRNIINNFTN